MKVYIYGSLEKERVTESEIKTVLEHVAETTDCRDLVVVLYLSVSCRRTGGRAYVRQWMRPPQLHPKRGHWTEFSQSPVPADIPRRFKLIRMMMAPHLCRYPHSEMDGYHWRHTFNTFYDHLALLFAHELHHFRRYHLNLHPKEGEHSANQWALQHVHNLGYSVNSVKLSKKRRAKRTRKISLASVFNPADFDDASVPGTLNSALKRAHLMLSSQAQNKYISDKLAHFERLRKLSPGDELFVTFDPNRVYEHQTATVVRVMRRNSVRIVIRTPDGKKWRWPMAWLEHLQSVN